MQRKDKFTASLADAMIGAAQELEQAAVRLKTDARCIRAHGLLELTETDCVDNQVFHKTYDIAAAAERARIQLVTR